MSSRHKTTEVPFDIIETDSKYKYKLKKRLGSGSFGTVYLAELIPKVECTKSTSSTTLKYDVAVKVEPIQDRHCQLAYESKIYKSLSGGVGIPSIRWFGTEQNYNVLVLDLLGPSLEDLFTFCSRKFSLKTVLLIADQMITRISYVHLKGFVHRDIKPDNFLMGTGKYCNMLYLIDFGLAKKFMDTRTKVHMQYRNDKNLTGTVRYASINAHRGIEQSRRDDLESMGYVMMYFNRGSLPWQGLKAANKKQKYEKICEKKMAVPIEELCKGFPVEFTFFLNYCRELSFEEQPDYLRLRQMFRALYKRDCGTDGNIYDWVLVEQKMKKPEAIKRIRNEKSAVYKTKNLTTVRFPKKNNYL